MIVGWVEKTAAGVRIWKSRTGRYFHDAASARSSKRAVVRHYNQTRARVTGYRRDPYILMMQHLDGQHAAVRVWRGNPERVA